MKLYEIDAAIESCIDSETGEILDLVKLTELQMERSKKIENVVLWYSNLESDIAALKEQEEFFSTRRKQAEGKRDSLKKWIIYTLGGEKFETIRAKVTFRKSSSVKVDEAKLPEEYLHITEVRKPDLEAIGEALRQGKAIEGAWLEESLNPQINKARKQ